MRAAFWQTLRGCLGNLLERIAPCSPERMIDATASAGLYRQHRRRKLPLFRRVLGSLKHWLKTLSESKVEQIELSGEGQYGTVN
jgi:hypothetical protein